MKIGKKWTLTIIFLVLLIIDLLVPDPLPLLDEIVLMLATAVAGFFAAAKK